MWRVWRLLVFVCIILYKLNVHVGGTLYRWANVCMDKEINDLIKNRKV